MKIKQTLIALALTAGLSTVLFPAVSYAAECGGVQTSIISCAQKGICQDGSDPYGKNSKDPSKDNGGKCEDGSEPAKDSQAIEASGVWGILLLVINIMTVGVGILAVAGIVYGSILYTSAGGSPDQVKKARTVIVNVVIGILAYLLMFSVLNFIIPGGVFA
jgi:hypothetical protein